MFPEQFSMGSQRCGVSVPHKLHHLFDGPGGGVFAGQQQTVPLRPYRLRTCGGAGCYQTQTHQHTEPREAQMKGLNTFRFLPYLQLFWEAVWSWALQGLRRGAAWACCFQGGRGCWPQSGTLRSCALFVVEDSWSWRLSPCSAAPLWGHSLHGAGSLLERERNATDIQMWFFKTGEPKFFWWAKFEVKVSAEVLQHRLICLCWRTKSIDRCAVISLRLQWTKH